MSEFDRFLQEFSDAASWEAPAEDAAGVAPLTERVSGAMEEANVEPFGPAGATPQEIQSEVFRQAQEPLTRETDLGFTYEGIPEDVHYWASACNALPGEQITACYQGLLKNAFGTDIEVKKSPYTGRPYFEHPETGAKTYVQEPGLTIKDVQYFGKHAAAETLGEVVTTLATLQLANRRREKEPLRPTPPSRGFFSKTKDALLALGGITAAESGVGVGSFFTNLHDLINLRERGGLPEEYGKPGDAIDSDGNLKIYGLAAQNAGLAQVGAVGGELFFDGIKRFVGGARNIDLGKTQEDRILNAIEGWNLSPEAKALQDLGAKEHLGHVLMAQSRKDIEVADKGILSARSKLQDAKNEAQRLTAQGELNRAQRQLDLAQMNENRANLITSWIDGLNISEDLAVARATSQTSVPHAAALLLRQRALQSGIAKDKLDLMDETGEAEWLSELSDGIIQHIDAAYKTATGKARGRLESAWSDADAWAKAAVNGARTSDEAGQKIGSLIRLGEAQFDAGVDLGWNSVRRFIDPEAKNFRVSRVARWAQETKDQILSAYPSGSKVSELSSVDQGTVADLNRVLDIVNDGDELIGFDRLNNIIRGVKKNRGLMYSDPSRGDPAILGDLVKRLEGVRYQQILADSADYTDPVTGKNYFRDAVNTLQTNYRDGRELYRKGIIRSLLDIDRKDTPGKIVGTLTGSLDPSNKETLQTVSRNVREFMENASPEDRLAVQEMFRGDLGTVDPEALDAAQLIRDAIKHDWAQKVIPTQRDRAFQDFVAKTGEMDEAYIDFISKDAHKQWIKDNQELVNYWFEGTDEISLFNEAADIGKRMLREERLFKNTVDSLNKQFNLKNINDPHELFQKVWIPWRLGGNARAKQVFHSLTRQLDDGTRVPLSKEADSLIQGFRTEIAKDLIRKTTKIGDNGNLEYVDLNKFQQYIRDHRPMYETWFNEPIELPEGKVTTGSKILNELFEAVRLASPQTSKKGINVVDDASSKAIMDLTRAYVGIFTTPGRIITAAKRIMNSANEKDLYWKLMDPEYVKKQIIKNRRWNNPWLQDAVRVLGATTSQGADWVSTDPEDVNAPAGPSPEFLQFEQEFMRPQRPSGQPTIRPERPQRFETPQRGPEGSPLSSFDFEPQKTASLPPMPPPQAAPKQGGIASYMPPSMRQPGSALAMAAQQRQQPVAMADGGYVDVSSRVDKAMAWRQKMDNKITVGKGRR